jgi:serine/threonine protein phosphatase PrpC
MEYITSSINNNRFTSVLFKKLKLCVINSKNDAMEGNQDSISKKELKKILNFLCCSKKKKKMKPIIKVIQHQGKRRYNEDRYLVVDNILDSNDKAELFYNVNKWILAKSSKKKLFKRFPNKVSLAAIFDGHNGAKVSEYASNKFYEIFVNCLKQNVIEYKKLGEYCDGENTGNSSYCCSQGGDTLNVRSSVEDGTIICPQDFTEVDEHTHHILKSLDDALKILESEVITLSKIKHWKSGSTAIVVLIVDEVDLYVSYVGDSSCALINKSSASEIIDTHSPNRADEKERILAAGGEVLMKNGVWRVNPGGLAMSRSIGDLPIKSRGGRASNHNNSGTMRPSTRRNGNSNTCANRKIVISDPESKHIHLKDFFKASKQHNNDSLSTSSNSNSNEKYLCVASDGLWDILSPSELQEIILTDNHKNRRSNYETKVKSNTLDCERNISDIRNDILNEALERGIEDNLTCIIMELDVAEDEIDMVLNDTIQE